MAKYDPLASHLSHSKGIVDLAFGDIEELLGFALPRSARRHAAWWSNSGGSHVQSLAWLGAGYRTQNVDVDREKVRFVPDGSKGFGEMKQSDFDANDAPLPKSPLFGSLKGTTTIMPGVDLTEPAFPDWAKLYDENYDPMQIEIDRIKDDLGLSAIGKVWSLHDLGLTPADICKALAVSQDVTKDALAARVKSRGW